MEFFRRAMGNPSTLAVFPGTFNPVTIAHVALAEAALAVVDEVAFVLPRMLPHKEYSGVPYEQRVQLLLAALANEERFSVASTARGLFVEIAGECRERYGSEVKLSFLCGADAAERVASWNYGGQGTFSGMVAQFELLVAERGGRFTLPHRPLELAAGYACVSATEVRERISRRDPWEHLVPAAVREQVRRIYSTD